MPRQITGLRWLLRARCRGMNTDQWFEMLNSRAKKICSECPVRKQCLNYALEAEHGKPANDRHGVFGGMASFERAREEQRRQAEKAVS